MDPQSSKPSEKKLENLIHSFRKRAKEASRKNFEMVEKVEMVNSLVDLFITRNAMRALKMNEERERNKGPGEEGRKDILKAAEEEADGQLPMHSSNDEEEKRKSTPSR